MPLLCCFVPQQSHGGSIEEGEESPSTETGVKQSPCKTPQSKSKQNKKGTSAVVADVQTKKSPNRLSTDKKLAKCSPGIKNTSDDNLSCRQIACGVEDSEKNSPTRLTPEIRPSRPSSLRSSALMLSFPPHEDESLDKKQHEEERDKVAPLASPGGGTIPVGDLEAIPNDRVPSGISTPPAPSSPGLNATGLWSPSSDTASHSQVHLLQSNASISGHPIQLQASELESYNSAPVPSNSTFCVRSQLATASSAAAALQSDYLAPPAPVMLQQLYGGGLQQPMTQPVAAAGMGYVQPVVRVTAADVLTGAVSTQSIAQAYQRQGLGYGHWHAGGLTYHLPTSRLGPHPVGTLKSTNSYTGAVDQASGNQQPHASPAVHLSSAGYAVPQQAAGVGLNQNRTAQSSTGTANTIKHQHSNTNHAISPSTTPHHHQSQHQQENAQVAAVSSDGRSSQQSVRSNSASSPSGKMNGSGTPLSVVTPQSRPPAHPITTPTSRAMRVDARASNSADGASLGFTPASEPPPAVQRVQTPQSATASRPQSTAANARAAATYRSPQTQFTPQATNYGHTHSHHNSTTPTNPYGFAPVLLQSVPSRKSFGSTNSGLGNSFNGSTAKRNGGNGQVNNAAPSVDRSLRNVPPPARPYQNMGTHSKMGSASSRVALSGLINRNSNRSQASIDTNGLLNVDFRPRWR